MGLVAWNKRDDDDDDDCLIISIFPVFACSFVRLSWFLSYFDFRMHVRSSITVHYGTRTRVTNWPSHIAAWKESGTRRWRTPLGLFADTLSTLSGVVFVHLLLLKIRKFPFSSYCSVYYSVFSMSSKIYPLVSKVDQVLILEPSSELKFKGLSWHDVLTTPLSSGLSVKINGISARD